MTVSVGHASCRILSLTSVTDGKVYASPLGYTAYYESESVRRDMESTDQSMMAKLKSVKDVHAAAAQFKSQ